MPPPDLAVPLRAEVYIGFWFKFCPDTQTDTEIFTFVDEELNKHFHHYRRGSNCVRLGQMRPLTMDF